MVPWPNTLRRSLRCLWKSPKQYPDIHLSPGYEFDQGDNKWSLGVSVTLPVLNHNQGAIGVAEARRTEAVARFNALRVDVLADVDLAAAGYRTACRKQAAAKAMLANLKQRETSAHARGGVHPAGLY